jgi:hypothetical protein
MNLKFKYFLPILLLTSALCTAQNQKGTVRLEVWGDTVSWIYTPFNSLINTTSMVIDYKNVDIDKGVMYECDSKPYGELVWDREKLEKGRWRIYIYNGTFEKMELQAVSEIFEIK